jgi:hypothetical protein
MEYTSLFDDEASEQTRKTARKKAQNRYLRYFSAVVLRVLWTSVALSAIVSLLIFVTEFFGISKVALPPLLGFLTGISLAAGILTSIQNRALITLLLGLLILPGLAIYLGHLAGSNPRAFDASISVLIPFLIYALAALFGGIIMAKIWQSMPARERQEETEKERVQDLTPQAKKESTGHEGSDLDKAA